MRVTTPGKKRNREIIDERFRLARSQDPPNWGLSSIVLSVHESGEDEIVGAQTGGYNGEAVGSEKGEHGCYLYHVFVLYWMGKKNPDALMRGYRRPTL